MVMFGNKKDDFLFDIAKYESTLENGKRVIEDIKGEKIEMLSTSYTNDGGHLNREGSKWVAMNFLLFLINDINR